MGRIGAAVARRGHFGYGMPVVFYDPVDVEPDHGISGVRRVDTVEEVLAVANFVSLHMPSGENAHLIDAGTIAGAGLDVYEGEPGIPPGPTVTGAS
jgi:phosphoglycerate dehydrogenase-like enzyme